MAVRTWAGDDATTPYDWSVTGNWVEGSVPVSTDEVVIPAGSQKITAGLNQSAVTLAGLTVESGYDKDIGSSGGELQVALSAPASIQTSGGQQFFDFGSSNVNVEVLGSGGASTGQRAINFIGSNLATVSIVGGSVGIASAPADSATVATLRILGGNVWLGTNVTLTTCNLYNGSFLQQCSSTTTTIYDGRLTSRGSGTIGTLNIYSGSCTLNSTGTVTTLNGYGGAVDFGGSGLARTVTTLNANATDPLTITFDPNVVTISTLNDPTTPQTVRYEAS
jgi:hypothetical protein